MTLQAVIDDSRDEDGTFVLAGYIASDRSWAQFTEDWEQLLPHAVMGRSGRYRFKMAEMATTDERMARVPAFFRVIETHVFGSISAKINVRDLERIQARIMVPNMTIDWGLYGNPYFVAFRCLMDKFHSERPNWIERLPEEQRIDFIFDEQTEKHAIADMWDIYIKERPDEIQKFYGRAPSFRDDEKFLPLQAADFWAWWVRKWYKEGTPEKVLDWGFDTFEPSRDKKSLRIAIEFDQDQLATSMINVLRNHICLEKPIIDLRGLDSFSPRLER